MVYSFLVEINFTNHNLYNYCYNIITLIKYLIFLSPSSLFCVISSLFSLLLLTSETLPFHRQIFLSNHQASSLHFLSLKSSQNCLSFRLFKPRLSGLLSYIQASLLPLLRMLCIPWSDSSNSTNFDRKGGVLLVPNHPVRGRKLAIK